MRWKANKPCYGNTRNIKKFIWFPLLLENDIYIWLERVKIEQVYTYDGWINKFVTGLKDIDKHEV